MLGIASDPPLPNSRTPRARCLASFWAPTQNATIRRPVQIRQLRGNLANKFDRNFFRDETSFMPHVQKFLRRLRDHFAAVDCKVIDVHAYKFLSQAWLEIARKLQRVV